MSPAVPVQSNKAVFCEGGFWKLMLQLIELMAECRVC